jgi:hypothetical protein
MAAYRLTPGWPESDRRIAIAFGAACALLTAAAVWCFWHPDVASERLKGATIVGAAVAAMFLFGVIMASRARAHTQYFVTFDAVTKSDGTHERRLERDEIVSVSEDSGGLRLRAIDHTMSVRIPRDLIDYEDCRRDVLALNIPPATPEQMAVLSRRLFVGRLAAVSGLGCVAAVAVGVDTRVLLAIAAVAVGAHVVLFIDRWRDPRGRWRLRSGRQALQGIGVVGSLVVRRLHADPLILLVLSLAMLASFAIERAEPRQSIGSVVR